MNSPRYRRSFNSMTCFQKSLRCSTSRWASDRYRSKSGGTLAASAYALIEYLPSPSCPTDSRVPSMIRIKIADITILLAREGGGIVDSSFRFSPQNRLSWLFNAKRVRFQILVYAASSGRLSVWCWRVRVVTTFSN